MLWYAGWYEIYWVVLCTQVAWGTACEWRWLLGMSQRKIKYQGKLQLNLMWKSRKVLLDMLHEWECGCLGCYTERWDIKEYPVDYKLDVERCYLIYCKTRKVAAWNNTWGGEEGWLEPYMGSTLPTWATGILPSGSRGDTSGLQPLATPLLPQWDSCVIQENVMPCVPCLVAGYEVHLCMLC